MRKDFLTAIVVTGIAMAVFYFLDHKSEFKNEDVKTVTRQQSVEKVSQLVSADIKQAQVSSTESKDQSVALAAISENSVDVQKKFSERLKELGQCLGMKNAVDNDKIDPTYDNLIVSLRPALGEVVVQMDDWSQRDLKDSNGELKRIRIESDYQNSSVRPVKRVQLYKLNNQNFPELQSLDPEKSVNPDDSYIDSLRAGASTYLEEKGGRAYYQEGEELVMIERNGKLESLTLSKGNKTVSCTGLDSLKSSCQCL